MTKILLAGATGLVGRDVLALLLADKRVTQVVAPTRRSIDPHPKLLNPIMDSESIPIDATWWAVDSAISALGTTRAKSPDAAAYRAIDYDFVLAIATQVRKHGATSFALVSSMGADVRSHFRYTRTKGELEAAVTALDFRALTIVRPGFLGGHRKEAQAMERIVGTMLRIAEPILPAAAKISTATTVAAMLVEAAIGGKPGKHIIKSTAITKAATQTTR